MSLDKRFAGYGNDPLKPGVYQCIFSSFGREFLEDWGICLGRADPSCLRGRATCLGRTTAGCMGRSAGSVRLSACIACVPSWLGPSTAYLVRIANYRGGATHLGTSTASLGMSACIPSWLGTSTTCLVRAGCLGRSTASLGMRACIAWIPFWLRISTAHLGRTICPRRSNACLGLIVCTACGHPWLVTNARYLGRVYPNCLGRKTTCLRRTDTNCSGQNANFQGAVCRSKSTT